MGFFDKLFKKEFAGDIDKLLEQQKSLQKTPGKQKEQPAARASAPKKKLAQSPRVQKTYPEEDPAKLQSLGLPVLRTKDDLAKLLGVSASTLNYLAVDQKSHYYAFTIPKRNGQKRRIFVPKKKLKGVQRKILREILEKLSATEYAHGFVKKRSIITNATPHLGKEIIVKMDLHNFFETITARRVYGLWRSFGYPRKVASTLTKIVTLNKKLPQGAPTSPALSNAISIKLDKRLSGLAKRFLATYTRYADDLTFSGGKEFKARLKSFLPMLWQIVKSEGFKVHDGKTVLVRKGNKQIVTGLVVNQQLGIERKKRDALRALLHNAKKRTLESQNREKKKDFRAHLLGKIQFIKSVNPRQGEKLQKQFAQVQ